MKRITMRNDVGLGPDNWFPYDNEKNRIYGRIAGGIGWPGEKPGAVVVAAQEMVLQLPAPVYILDVFQSRDLSELIDKAIEFRNNLIVGDGYFCDCENENAMAFLAYRRKIAVDKRNAVLNYRSAPIGENHSIEHPVNILKEHLKPNIKRIWLEGFTEISSALNALPPNVSGIKAGDHPLVTATALAVFDLVMNPRSDQGDRMKPTGATTEYDVLNHGME